MQTWSGWKRFPDGNGGNDIDAPAGPGVYEIRHTLTGRVMAFGHSGHVAQAIAAARFNGDVGLFAKLFGRPPIVSRVSDLEYRSCAAASRADAKAAAQRLLGLRQKAWRRRIDIGWSTRHAG